MALGYGVCRFIVHDEVLGDRYQERDEPAFVQDGSDYFGALRTREDFGCTSFRPKSSVD